MGKKYYAIKLGKNVTDKIVTSWKTCKPLVIGCPSVFRSFTIKEDAEQYLKTVNKAKVLEIKAKSMEKKKVIKATTRTIQTRIPKDIYAEFLCKCEEMEFSTDTVILKLIKEWIEE